MPPTETLTPEQEQAKRERFVTLVFFIVPLTLLGFIAIGLMLIYLSLNLFPGEKPL